MQHEITKSIPLLNNEGNLTQPGYARRLLPVYDRRKIKCSALRIKEWDYYYIGSDRFGVALTIADNGYMGLDSISFLEFGDEPWQITKSPMRILPLGKTKLPSSSAAGVSRISGKGYRLEFRVQGAKRILTARMDNFRNGESIDVDLTLSREPEESMVICTPFEKKGHFYYNQKINCMRAEGRVKIGQTSYDFNPENSFAVLDWGRGVWTYHNTWYWGSASGVTEDGSDFGFNIGYGFGDTSAASENMLFYRGKAHKLEDVRFEIPMKDGHEDYLRPWKFTSSGSRFEMDFMPVIDRASCTDFKLLKSDQHQVFGRFSGKVVLDDGTNLKIRELMGFAEKVENKW